MDGFSDSLKSIRNSLKSILNPFKSILFEILFESFWINLNVLKIYLNRFGWVFKLTKKIANTAKKKHAL